MSHSQFHCTGRVYLDLHGLSFETSICYWQDQPGSLPRRPRPSAKREAPPEGTPPAILLGGLCLYRATTRPKFTLGHTGAKGRDSVEQATSSCLSPEYEKATDGVQSRTVVLRKSCI